VRGNDGRKLDHQTLEVMRLRAVDAVESGVHPEDVAASLGMGRGTVYGWLAKYREGGRDALKARPVPGRPPKLTGEQMRRLYTLIAGSDPRQLEFAFALWTRDMVRELIRREFRVSLSAVSVGRLLRTLGLSPQRPLWRAWQADPRRRRAVEERAVPGHPQAGQDRGRDDLLRRRGRDPLGLPRRHHLGPRRAHPGGQGHRRPTQPEHDLRGDRAGAAAVSTYTGSFTAARFIEFCRKLLADSDRPVYLIVDGHPTHRSKAVKQFVDSTDGRLRLFVLPAYSPQLNPDEWVWKNVKHDRVGRTSVTGPAEFKTKVIGALRRLQKMPHIVRAFFADPELRYIAA